MLKFIISITTLCIFNCFSIFCQDSVLHDRKWYVDSCDFWNHDKNGKHDLQDLNDVRLKRILKRFFVLDEDTTLYDFNRYPLKYLDSMTAEYGLYSNLPKGYEVKMNLKIFDLSKHKIKYRVYGDDICQIDNKGFWGTFTYIPKFEIGSIKVKYNGITINIPNNQYNDIFFLYLNNWNSNAMIAKKGEYFIFMISGGDGAGSFVSIWIFKNNKYIGRVVENIC